MRGKQLAIIFPLLLLTLTISHLSVIPVYAQDNTWSEGDYSKWIDDAFGPYDETTPPITGVDDFSSDQLERPCSQSRSDYYPFIDIKRVGTGWDDNFVYLAIDLVNSDKDGLLPEQYGFELDVDGDGRGDFYMQVNSPSSNQDGAGVWSRKALYIWEDSDEDVGDSDPSLAEGPQGPDNGGYDSLNGYDSEFWVEGKVDYPNPDGAWYRIPTWDTTVVEFAIERDSSWLGEDPVLALIRAWAGKSNLDHTHLYYHDYYSESQYGSVYSYSGNVYEIDNLGEIGNWVTTPWFDNLPLVLLATVGLLALRKKRAYSD